MPTPPKANLTFETIIDQLSPTGIGGLRAMLEARVASTRNGGLAMLFKGSRKYNLLKIELDKELDSYTVELSRLNPRTGQQTRPEVFEDVYADRLRPLFEDKTGLRTALHGSERPSLANRAVRQRDIDLVPRRGRRR